MPVSLPSLEVNDSWGFRFLRIFCPGREHVALRESWGYTWIKDSKWDPVLEDLYSNKRLTLAFSQSSPTPVTRSSIWKRI